MSNIISNENIEIMNVIYGIGMPKTSTGYYNRLTEPFIKMVEVEKKMQLSKIFTINVKFSITAIQKNNTNQNNTNQNNDIIYMGHNSSIEYKELINNMENKVKILNDELKNHFYFKIMYSLYKFHRRIIDKNNIDIEDILHNTGLYVLPKYRKHGLGKSLIQKRMERFKNKILISITTNRISYNIFKSCGWKNLAYISYNEVFKHYNLNNEILNNDKISLWIFISDDMKNKYNNINIDINEVDITNEIIGDDTTINIENNTDNIN
jgi:GNAT superfamily N-acetyltransferase